MKNKQKAGMGLMATGAGMMGVGCLIILGIPLAFFLLIVVVCAL